MGNQIFIQTFGKFAIKNGQHTVQIPFKRSQKAQEITRFFITYRNRKISKDFLCDEFWPGMDFYSAKHNLSTTLYLIRKGFDKVAEEKGFGKKMFRSSSQMCWFELPENVVLDVDYFKQLQKKASLTAKRDEKIALYREMEAIYKGDFLPEQPYSDWAIAIREECKEMAVEHLCELIKLLIEEKDYKLAKYYQGKAIKIDPFNEGCVLLKMTILKEEERYIEALKIFDSFEKNLKEEFGFTPSPTLESFKKKILLLQEACEKKNHFSQKIHDERYVNSQVFKKFLNFELSQRECNSALLEIQMNIEWGNVPWLFDKVFNCIICTLRKGDIITHDDKNFYILLKNIKKTHLDLVIERITSHSLIKDLFCDDNSFIKHKTYPLHEYAEAKKEMLPFFENENVVIQK